MVDVDRNRDNLFADNAGDLHSRSDGVGLLLNRLDIGWIGQDLEATSSRVHFTGLSFSTLHTGGTIRDAQCQLLCGGCDAEGI